MRRWQYANITFAGSSSFTIGTVGTTNAITVGASPTTVGVIRNTSTVSQAFSGPVNLVGGSVFRRPRVLDLQRLFNIGNGGGATAEQRYLLGQQHDHSCRGHHRRGDRSFRGRDSDKKR
jgi:hypothetical protein